MFNKAKPAADAFAFSLGGMTTIAAFAAVPVIADDRINRIRDERREQDRSESAAPAWLAGTPPATEGTAV